MATSAVLPIICFAAPVADLACDCRLPSVRVVAGGGIDNARRVFHPPADNVGNDVSGFLDHPPHPFFHSLPIAVHHGCKGIAQSFEIRHQVVFDFQIEVVEAFFQAFD